MKKTSNISPSAITTLDYWEDTWANKDVPDAIDPHQDAPENHYYRVMHSLITSALGAYCPPGARLIEIGCGGSRWLPYFHREFGYDISGIDYTVAGIRLSQAILDRAGIGGRVVQGDLFEPPPEWINRFDVVVSFGLVEHFENTAQVITACTRYLRPSGRIITLVPTMRGLYGLAYRLLRPSVYRKHIPHSRETLAQAHMDAGLNIISCNYVLGLPGIISAPISSGLFSGMAFAASRLYWKLERTGWGIPPNRYTSPHALCVAMKPGHEQGDYVGD